MIVMSRFTRFLATVAKKSAPVPVKQQKRKPATAYALFCNEKFQELEHLHIPERVRAIFKEWKNMDSDSKKKYYDQAQDYKAEWQQRNKKGAIDKRPPTSYNLFIRKFISERDPGSSAREFIPAAALKWKSMNAVEKQPFITESQALSEEFNKPKFVRPKSATSPYAQFIKAKYNEVRKSLPSDTSFQEISRQMSATWKSLPEQEKNVFVEAGQREMQKKKEYLEDGNAEQ
uniref:HMG box domain-containing protein n=1 Tax=Spongospora subterranea TaxID=70186 RepID=A0A0H5R6N1_9EUKA|eukprot:CRZ09481.1 hypothetical protein [Spongospora subterranea]